MFGRYCRKLRIKNGVTLRAFCKANGYDPSNISKMERGIFMPPKGEKLFKLAKAYGCKDQRSMFEFFNKAFKVKIADLKQDRRDTIALACRMPKWAE